METTDLLPGTLDMLILRTLALGPNHGYGIAQHIHRVSGDALRVGEGSLYPALQRLLLNRWVEAEWAVSETKRRARYYKITPAGHKRLAAEVKSFQFLVSAIAAVMEGA